MADILHYLKFKNLSKKSEKYVFHREKWKFEHIGNSVYTAESLALGKALKIYIEYFMFFLIRQHVKWQLYNYKQCPYIQQWFDDEQGAKFM